MTDSSGNSDYTATLSISGATLPSQVTVKYATSSSLRVIEAHLSVLQVSAIVLGFRQGWLYMGEPGLLFLNIEMTIL